jgi:ACS family tartrate transporter-like MFS transporter
MSLESSGSATDPEVDPEAVRRKVARRLLPLVFVLYIVSYLDRANVGFAKLRMQGALGFSEEVFGWGFGIFFAGYLILEIPGALLVERWSARKWFARILVTWGACSMGMAAVRTPWQFYGMRFLLGLAESGFFPGVIVYFAHWFPRAERGRAMAGMLLAIPVSLALGSRVSGLLLDVHWFGLAGWQWVFLVEGMPAVIIGLALPFLMTDRPGRARWLAPAERAWLEETLQMERLEAAAVGGVGLGRALRSPAVWLLALGILAANTGGYGLVFWLPTATENLLQATGREATPSAVLDWLGFVYLFGLAGVWLSGQATDRSGRPKWLCAAGMVLTGAFLAASAAPGQPWGAVFAWLCAAYFFALSWPSPFWVLPTLTLSASAAAVAIGVINICANLAGLLGSPVVGQMKAAGLGDRACLLFLAACYASGGAVITAIRIPAVGRRPVEPGIVAGASAAAPADVPAP